MFFDWGHSPCFVEKCFLLLNLGDVFVLLFVFIAMGVGKFLNS